MKWLVTGGGGFLGRHLSAALLRNGDQISYTGADCDITDSESVMRVMAGADGCYHLAGVASIQRCDLDPMGSYRLNVGGTVAVFDAAARLIPPVPVVYASSAAVYGDAERQPVTEETECRPISAYGGAKLSCEIYASIAKLMDDVPSIGLRFFNVYGPGQSIPSAIPLMADQIKAGKPVTIYGNGTHTRDFIYVDDAVDTMLAAMARIRDVSAPALNVCTGVSTSIFRLAEMMVCILGKDRSLIRFASPRRGEIRHSVGSPDLSRWTLGLLPPMPLLAGLTTTIAHSTNGS